MYTTLATSRTPALIIYLLDLSASMNTKLDGKPRVQVVGEAMTAAMRQMIYRSTKGSILSPRYRIAVYGYSDDVYDVYDGIKTIDEAARLGPPALHTLRTTNTAKGFTLVEKLLTAELEHLHDCPAPLVCHMTDGEYTGEDPTPIVQRIRSMAVPDGHVLVENIFISDDVLPTPITDPRQWEGIRPKSRLKNKYAALLRDLSSPLPESFRGMMLEMNYHVASDAVMMLPGTSPELVAMGFQMSAATPMR